MTGAAASLVGTRLELDVGPVAHGGHCVARADGRVVFVRHALPGERVVAEVTEGDADSRFLRADAIEILRTAPGRVAPPCRYAGPGRCGGCSWQHATLAEQRLLKAAVVREAFERFAGLDVSPVVEPVPGDADGLGWRTRVTYAIDDAGRPGLRRHRSRVVVPIDQCLIAHPAASAVGVSARRWAGAASVEAVGSAATGERVAIVGPAGRPRVGVDPPLGADVPVMPRRPRAGDRVYLTERAAGREWRIRADAFWQVHPGAADTLAAAVVSGVEPRAGEHVLDLYSGVGLFAATLAPYVAPDGAGAGAGRIVGVEADAGAVESARANLATLPTVTVVRGDVGAVLSFAQPDEVDVVVLDPPRDGAGRDVMTTIGAVVGPRVIAYVACDPVALARDISYVLSHGYALSSLRAFDCFPMTHHVECVAVLNRV